MPSRGHLGAISGPSWDLLGLSWGHLEASWGPLGPSWGHPGRSPKKEEIMKMSVSLGFFGGQSQSVWKNTYVLTLAYLERREGGFGRVFGGKVNVCDEDNFEEVVRRRC